MERLKTIFTLILWYKFLFVKVIHFGGRRDAILNLNNVDIILVDLKIPTSQNPWKTLF